VRENLAFGLKLRKTDAAEIQKRVAEASEVLGLAPLLDRLPKALSGGQRQRVAMGRAIVRRPSLFLFDEPLSNLDAALRSQIRVELKALQRDLKKTTIYVTHDQIEAMTMADRIVVLHKGVLQQVGTPEELYLSPKNTFVARFIGSPSMSLVRGDVEAGVFKSGELRTPLAVRPGPTILGVRAEDVLVHHDGALAGVVRSVEPVGETGYLHLEVAGMRVDPASLGAPGSATETPRAPLLSASIPGREAFATRVGAQVRFSLRDGRAHAFDPDSGDALAAERA
jgi:ABC-type sugar transport system ATPase subunit